MILDTTVHFSFCNPYATFSTIVIFHVLSKYSILIAYNHFCQDRCMVSEFRMVFRQNFIFIMLFVLHTHTLGGGVIRSILIHNTQADTTFAILMTLLAIYAVLRRMGTG